MEICQHNLPSIRIGVKEICAGQMLSDSVSHVFWSRDSGDGQSTKSDKSQTYLPAHNHDVKLGDFDDREWFVFRFPLKKSCVATATPFPRLTLRGFLPPPPLFRPKINARHCHSSDVSSHVTRKSLLHVWRKNSPEPSVRLPFGVIHIQY